jgi:DNA-binding PadR family transcriptional regulator
MSSETGQSISTLDRLRKSGLGCGYIKENKGDVYYPLTELAKYYCNKVIKTA